MKEAQEVLDGPVAIIPEEGEVVDIQEYPDQPPAEKMEESPNSDEAKKIMAALQDLNKASQKIGGDRPERENFDSDEDFLDGLIEWKIAMRDQGEHAKTARQLKDKVFDHTESLYEKAAAFPGFDREKFDALPLSKAMAHTLLSLDFPEKVMAYMSSKPEEVKRISGMNMARQAAEIGKIEERLLSNMDKKERFEPIKPINGMGSVGSSTDLQKSDLKTYKELRAKQGARWAN